MNPEPFLQLDRVIHEKGRMAIMSLLAANDAISFTEIRDLLQMTDGNLSMHIKTLQEAGYLSVAKSYRNRRPLTTLTLTTEGRTAFERYVGFLADIVAQTQKPK